MTPQEPTSGYPVIESETETETKTKTKTMTIRQRDLSRLTDRELIARARRESEKGESRTVGQRAYRDSLEAELEARDLLQESTR